MSWPLVHYVLTAAVRDRLIMTLVLALVVIASLSVFLGSAAINEKDQFISVYAGGGIRLMGVLGLTLFIVFFIRRSFEARDIEFLLSRPIGRAQFLFSYAGSFSLIALILALAQIFALYILGPHLFGYGHIMWGFSIIAENVIVACAALFFSLWLTSASASVMAVLGLYGLARLSGELLGIIDSGKDTAPEAMEFVMQAVTVLAPRLDLFGQTSWLIYGPGETGYGFLALQCVVYSGLLLLAGLYDLIKRQF
ncbi:MAG: hypothetical protein L6Q57_05635 [Alphaproteobacteria bacterium]|nr:hypothetical protein [Alphaproteobacteria bacterium]